jgi:deoxycytidine triphosphate deaminase
MIRRLCREHGMITPFVDYDEPRPPRAISYGLTTAGYDMRVGNTFYVFKNTAAGSVIDSIRLA